MAGPADTASARSCILEHCMWLRHHRLSVKIGSLITDEWANRKLFLPEALPSSQGCGTLVISFAPAQVA